MRFSKGTLALQYFRRPLFCCEIQESQSTVDEIWPCPVHDKLCSFVEHALVPSGGHENVVTRASDTDGPSPCAQSRFFQFRAWLSSLPFQPSFLFNLRHSFTRQTRPIVLPQPTVCDFQEASSLITRLSNDYNATSASHETLSSASDHGSGLSYIFPKANSGIDLESLRKSKSATQGATVAHSAVDTVPCVQSLTSLCLSKPQDDLNDQGQDHLLNTILFEERARSLFAFSGDLVQGGSKYAHRRTTLWAHAKGQEECTLRWEVSDGGLCDLVLYLRYEMVDLVRLSRSSRFAARVCISQLLPGVEPTASSPGSDDDVWLSVAEEESSSAASISSKPKPKHRPGSKALSTALFQPEFCMDVARVISSYRYGFVLQRLVNRPDRLEVAYCTPALLEKITSCRTSFSQAIQLECALQHDNFEQGVAIEFPFLFGDLSGIVCCIPLYQNSLHVQWFCVLLKQAAPSGYIRSVPPPRRFSTTKQPRLPGTLG